MQSVSGKLNDKFYECVSKLEDARFEVKDTSISSRMVNYYDSQGFLYNSNQEGNKKRKFSTIQVCWLKVVKDLLAFGYDREKIFHIKRGLEQFEYADAAKGRFYDTLTFHLALIVSQKMDWRIVLNKDEAFAWTMFSNTHMTEIASNRFLHREPTLTIPLVPKVEEEWEKITGVMVDQVVTNFSPIEVEEKELLDTLKNKTVFKVELSFPDNFTSTSGKGKVLHKLEDTDTKRLGEFLRHMKHGEVRITYGEETGVPLYASVAKTIKFKSRKEAVGQIIRRTK